MSRGTGLALVGLALVGLAALGLGLSLGIQSGNRTRGEAHPSAGRAPEPEPEPAALVDADVRSRFELDQGYGSPPVPADAEHEEPTRPEPVTLEPAASLRAVILRAGLPAPDLRLNVKQLRPPSILWASGDARWKATAGVDGVAWLEDLPTHVALEVAVFGEGKLLRRLEEHVVLEPGELRELEIRIGSGCTIHGVAITPGGTPVAGLSVWLLAARGSRETRIYESADAAHALARRTTDAAGAFLVEDVGVGRWYVGLAPKETLLGPLVPLARLVTVEQDQRRMDVELTVHRELFIRGRVFDPEGKLVERAMVSTDSGIRQEASRGEFELGPLAPGEVHLVASATRNGVLRHSERVLAHAGDMNVVIAFRAPGSISGRCVDRNGKPHAARARLMAPYGRLEGVRTVVSSNGPAYFAFTGLAPGRYHVVASDDLGNFGTLADVVVEASEALRDLKVVLEPGATVNVRLEGDWTRPGELLQVRLLQNGVEVSNGFGKKVVPSGEVTVALCARDLETKTLRTLESRELTLGPGSEVEVVFTLEGE